MITFEQIFQKIQNWLPCPFSPLQPQQQPQQQQQMQLEKGPSVAILAQAILVQNVPSWESEKYVR